MMTYTIEPIQSNQAENRVHGEGRSQDVAALRDRLWIGAAAVKIGYASGS
jgi:hypothetical protein